MMTGPIAMPPRPLFAAKGGLAAQRRAGFDRRAMWGLPFNQAPKSRHGARGPRRAAKNSSSSRVSRRALCDGNPGGAVASLRGT